MTLIIAAANTDNVILVGDRRLTLPTGEVVDEETCKLTVYACPDTKLMIAYTGLATTGTETTGNWIINTLSAASSGSPSIYEVIEIFKNIANSEYEGFSTKLNTSFKVELIFAGYYYSNTHFEPKIWKVSNYNNTNEFRILSCGSGDDVSFLELAGCTNAVSEKCKREIIQMMSQGKPTHGIEMKLVHAIKSASNNRRSLGKVGKQINSCCLSSKVNSQFTATYHSDVTQNVMYAVNSVFSFSGDNPSIMMDATLTTGSESPPASIPKVKPSQLCKCGSGEKYKHCHAKIKYPYLPLSHEFSFNDRSFDSGRRFIARSYGASAL